MVSGFFSVILQGAAVLEHSLTGCSSFGDSCREFCNFSPSVHGIKAQRKLQVLTWISEIIEATPTLFSPSPPPIIFFPFSGMQACRERLLSFYGGSQLWLFEVFFLMYWHGFTWFFSQKKKILEETCWRMCWFRNHNPKLPISEGWHIRAMDFSFIL